ncbi:unnamed protein product, partial [Urochloa humidicola]
MYASRSDHVNGIQGRWPTTRSVCIRLQIQRRWEVKLHQASVQPAKQNLLRASYLVIDRAMEFATVGLGTLLPKLAKLLQDEYNLQKGAREGIEFLYKELERTQAALREVGEVPLEQLSETIRLWARDVREVSYDMEDIVDTFTVRVQGAGPPSKRSVKRFIKKMSNIVTEVKTRREVTKEIDDIKKRVKEVAELRDRYKKDGTIAPTKKTL